MPMPLNQPTLWIVATPLGNFEDLSPRARAILSTADLVLAEDTRVTSKLLAQCGLKARRISSFYEHNEQQRQAEVLNLLRNGANVALVSDAGTPLMADPGYRLVRACRQNNIRVSPVPGPSAPVAALSAAGIPPLPFSFLGFLPRGEKDRQNLFHQFHKVPGSLIFFERKDRLKESLSLAFACLGNREVAICRELTKTYEEFIFGQLTDYENIAADLLGEITVILGPPQEMARTPEATVREIFRAELARGLKPRKAAAATQKQCAGWTGADIYALAFSEKI